MDTNSTGRFPHPFGHSFLQQAISCHTKGLAGHEGSEFSVVAGGGGGNVRDDTKVCLVIGGADGVRVLCHAVKGTVTGGGEKVCLVIGGADGVRVLCDAVKGTVTGGGEKVCLVVVSVDVVLCSAVEGSFTGGGGFLLSSTLTKMTDANAINVISNKMTRTKPAMAKLVGFAILLKGCCTEKSLPPKC
jgi:hypothetical protein